jgi:hypothetical protein
MATALNRSEQFVFDVCQKSFLSMWSYVNPQGKRPDKELCDILVICDPHVIVISVKECEFKGAEFADTPVELDDHKCDDADKRPSPYKVACDRWTRNAVDESIKQVNGAVRMLDKARVVLQKNGTPCLPLPPIERRVYHRIAIAIGGKEFVPLTSKIEDGLMVNVWDEVTFWHLLRYLNTITDFTDYLQLKMQFFTSRPRLSIVTEGEEDLLAFFLHQNNSFPKEADFIMIEGGGWKKLLRSSAYKRKVIADEISYIWDDLIETVTSGGCVPEFTKSTGGMNMEQALRTMAKECRYDRRNLAKSLQEFLHSAKKGIGRARLCRSQSRINYVFFVYDQDSALTARQSELYCRCLSTISLFPESHTVVGIGMNIPGKPPKEGSNIILCQISCEGGWSDDTLAQSQELRDKCGYFNGPARIVSLENEFPTRKR